MLVQGRKLSKTLLRTFGKKSSLRKRTAPLDGQVYEVQYHRDGCLNSIFSLPRMLKNLLQSLNKLRYRYQFDCLVGTSNHQPRKRCSYEFADSANLSTLNDFRSHKFNILMTASVLEEGIDVAAHWLPFARRCQVMHRPDAAATLVGRSSADWH